jgi:elongation factor P--(R)-beta-lysine ligase
MSVELKESSSQTALKKQILRDRAHLFATVRSFFEKKGVLEVDCPALSLSSAIDAHIDVMEVFLGTSFPKGFLHTSPEYGLKRLLAQDLGDLYQMSHVFRAAEYGSLHQPEFTLIEWYRLGFSLKELIAETLELIALFLPAQPTCFFTYRDLFLKYAGIDPFQASPSSLAKVIGDQEISSHSDPLNWDYTTQLHLLMSHHIEPQLKKENLTVIYDFPPQQAMLSEIEKQEDGEVAKRFEIYYKGIELANGFLELRDPEEQRRRLKEEQIKREALGKPFLPPDEEFIESLSSLPSCCGVAVGFDRLMMLRHGTCTLQEILPINSFFSC